MVLCLMLLPTAALAATNVPYLDANGFSQTCSSATEVASDTTTWSGGWYVAQNTVEIGSRVTVSGAVHLILADGCTLTVNGGIQVASGNSLTIYGQSAEGTGSLTATGSSYNAGIGGNNGTGVTVSGTITINGGTVNATGGTDGAGIGGGQKCGGGTITINGGNVTAIGKGTSRSGGAGIGGGLNGSGGTITINGGNVTATGKYGGAGIGGANAGVEKITISGGTVTATGGTYGAGIGGGKDGSGGTITISGGTVNATSKSGAGIGGGYQGGGGSFATTGTGGGTAIIKAGSIADQSNKSSWSGIIFEGSTGGVYGRQTLSEAFTVESTETLLISDGATLTTNNKLTNSGKVYVDGTLSGTVSGNVHYRLSVTDGTASPTYSYNDKAYGKAGETVTLAAVNPEPSKKVFDRWASGSVTVENNRFTMPAKAVAVTAIFADPLTITTQPADKAITYGETTTLSVAVEPHRSLGVAAPSYQWYENDAEISGAIAASYTTPNDLNADTHSYKCVITCGGYTVTSNNATVTVGKAAPALTAPTANTLAYNGNEQALVTAGTTTDGTMQYALSQDGSYSDTIPTGTSAGSYTVWYKVVGDGNHNDSSPASVQVTIDKLPVTVSGITAQNKTYDGNTDAELVYTNAVFIEKLASDTLSVTATGAFTDQNAGTGKTVKITGLTLTGDSAGNYILATNGQQATTTATISPKPVTVTIQPKSSAYGADIVNLTATDEGIVEGDTGVYTLSTTATSSSPVGSYDITGTSNSSNYAFTFDGEAKAYTITKASLSPSVTMGNWTYGNTATEPVVTGNTENGAVTYRYKVKDADDGGYGTTKPTNAGSYTVEATIAATANYQQAVVFANFTIDKKELTVTGLTATKRVYAADKTTVELTGGTLDGVVDNDEVSAQMPTSGTIASADAGNDKAVDFGTITLTGAKAGNYTLTQPTVTVNIEPLGVDEPTVSGTYTYDRTMKTVTLDGFENSYMSVTGNTGTNAGNYTATVTLDANHKWNTGSDGSVEWIIRPKPVTATVTVTPKDYDGNTTATVNAVVTTTEGLINGDRITITGLTGTFVDDANVGDDKPVTVNAAGKSITGTDASNYDVTIPANATGTITQTTNTWATDPAVTDWTYGDTPIAPAGAAQFGSVAVSYTGTDYDSAEPPTKAGSYTVHFTVEATDNYTTISAERSLTIGKKTIGIDWTDTELTYNGQPQKPTATATGLEDGDTCAITVTGEKTNAGSYTATATSLGNDNYQLPDDTTTTFSIARREVTVTAGTYEVSKIYDGGLSAGTADGELTVTGILDADSGVTVNATPGAYTSPNVGGQDTVAVSLTLSGDTNNNYQLASHTVTVPCTITAKPISINTATATNRDYEANNTSVEADVTFTGAVNPLAKNTDYTVAGTMADADAGTGKTVDVTVTLLNENYALADNSTTTTVTINKIAYPGITAANGSAMYGNSGRVDLSNYLADGYVIGAITKTNGDIFTGAPGMDGTALTFSFANVPANVGQTAVITVPVTGTTNYDPYSIAVTVTVEAKTVPTVTAPTAAAGLIYSGEAQTLISAGSTTGGEMQYSLTSGTGYSAVLPTAVNAGDYTVYYKVVGNSDYADVAENSLTVTIGKREVTATPKDVTITRGSAIPAFELIYTGLLGEDTLTPGADPTFTCFEADGTTAVSTGTAAGTYTITWTNANIFDGETNYRVVAAPGTLTINNPSYSGDSSSTTTTEKNPDGSTTTTVTDKATGTVTETTKNTDGSTAVVETKKDGTVTETNKTADGTTGTVVTDKNGTVTEVKSSVSSAAAREAAKTGEAVTLPVEVPAVSSTGDAPAVEVSVPKSAGSVKVEIPVEKVTPGTVAVIVHADGTEEIVKTSIPTENGVVLTLAGSATVKIVDNAKAFVDIHLVNHWAEDAVDFASARGITGGTSDTTFSPNASCTRAQIVTFLWRAAGSPEPENLSDFSDVSADAYYAKAVAWALENGITGGTGNGMFSPDATCTRSQSVTFLYRAAGSPTASDDIAFGDVTAESYYADAVAWAAQNGITSGIGSGLFGPANECSRAQIVTFLYRWLVK